MSSKEETKSEEEETHEETKQEEKPDEQAEPESLFTVSSVQSKLRPYTNIYENIQSMLFWRRPIPMIILLVITELILIFIYQSNLGFFSVLSVLITLRYIVELVYHKFGEQISQVLFKEIDRGNANEPNKIYPLEPFCKLFVGISNRLYLFVMKLFKDRTPNGLLYSTTIYFILFIIFWFCGTFSIMFILIHLILLGPGILMHPKVYPYSQKYLKYILDFAENNEKIKSD